jgi:hypothetical protein
MNEGTIEGTQDVATDTASTERTDEDRATERGLANAPMTGALIATNIGVFVAQVFLAGSPRFALGGGAGHDANVWSAVLRWLGANHSTFTIADNRLETLVTSCFLHGSALHLAFNMVVLYQVGPFLERAVGRRSARSSNAPSAARGSCPCISAQASRRARSAPSRAASSARR